MDETIPENDTLQNELDNYESSNVAETETPVENEGTEDLETLKKENQTLKVQKGLYKTKYEELKSKLPTNPAPKKIEAIPAYDPIELVKLTNAIKDYNAEELEFITKFAKSSSPKDIIDATTNEWVKTAISAKREKLEKDNKIPNSTSPNMSTDPVITKGMTDEEIDKLTKEKFEKAKRQKGGSIGA